MLWAKCEEPHATVEENYNFQEIQIFFHFFFLVYQPQFGHLAPE